VYLRLVGLQRGQRAAQPDRLMRACTVGTGTRNARAISSLDRPPTTRRVSATRASGESTGWQLTNIRHPKDMHQVLGERLTITGQ
jgi:hypothetical protein